MKLADDYIKLVNTICELKKQQDALRKKVIAEMDKQGTVTLSGNKGHGNIWLTDVQRRSIAPMELKGILKLTDILTCCNVSNKKLESKLSGDQIQTLGTVTNVPTLTIKQK